MSDLLDYLNWKTNSKPDPGMCRCGEPLHLEEFITREWRDDEWRDEPMRILACRKSKYPLSADHTYAMVFRWAAQLGSII
jgi:hypothetical protein